MNTIDVAPCRKLNPAAPTTPDAELPADPPAQTQEEKSVPLERSIGEAVKAAVVPCAGLSELDIPKRERVLGDWFRQGDYGMIVAPRGVGKTWFALGLSGAIARGGCFGPWKAAAARKVLYVDGEMAVDDLDRWIRGLGQTDNLLVLSHEALHLEDGATLNLARQEDRQALSACLQDNGVEVLVLDNLSCLASGLRENDGDAWQPMKQWFLELRRSRIAVVLVHHAGKDGSQRGTSRREDDLFWALSLEDRRKGGEGGVCFGLKFTKNRNSPRDESCYEWCFKTADDGTVQVSAEPIGAEVLFRQLVEQGETSATKIAKVMKVAKSTVSKWAKAGCAAKWMKIDGGKYLPTAQAVEPVSNAEAIGGKQETEGKMAA